MKTRSLQSMLMSVLLGLAGLDAHEPQPIPFNPVGIPYAWHVELEPGDEAELPPDHVGAWSWDEDGFSGTARGWTHTSKWVKLELEEASEVTLILRSKAGVAWPSPTDTNRLAGTNLFPSLTLYRGWDTDAGLQRDTNGMTIDQNHTFNNRGNIDWAEDLVYLDHLENSTAHEVSRTWTLAAGEYSINFGGNSPATVAEGRQGYAAIFTTMPAAVAITNAAMRSIEFDPVGVPYGNGISMDDHSSVETIPDHVGAWSWDEDGFLATARGWTHTSKWIKLELTKSAFLTLALGAQADVLWPSPTDAFRLAGTNLFPSFSIYRGWDTDAGLQRDTNGMTIDQNHTFNNRGNIDWAEDLVYLDHLENSTLHEVTRTWALSAGRYSINLGGNSPATVAEGRQGFRAEISTSPLPVLSMIRSGSELEISWSTIPPGLRLYRTDRIVSGDDGKMTWTLAPGLPQKMDGRWVQKIPRAVEREYFALGAAPE